MRTVYKYPVEINEMFTIELPEDAEILDVQLQGNYPTLWALLDTESPTVKRVFRLAGTGHPIPSIEILEHIGTFQMAGGTLVWHVFELMGAKK